MNQGTEEFELFTERHVQLSFRLEWNGDVIEGTVAAALQCNGIVGSTPCEHTDRIIGDANQASEEVSMT